MALSDIMSKLHSTHAGYIALLLVLAIFVYLTALVTLSYASPIGFLAVFVLFVIVTAIFIFVFRTMHKTQLYYTSLVFAVIGLVISIYLTIVHYYPSVPLECSTAGLINCNNVLNSQYAVVFGVPLAVMGVIFFLAQLITILFVKNSDVFLSLSGIGIAVVAYGIFSEYAVGAVCEYCTAVHLCAIGLLIIAILQETKKK